MLPGRVNEMTGRDFAINGNIRIAVFPAPGLVVSDVSLANWTARSSAPHVDVEVGGNPRGARPVAGWSGEGGDP